MKKILVVLWMSIVLVGCSGSERKIDQAVQSTMLAFREDTLQPNTEAGLIKLHLPKRFKIEESSENNVILKRDKQSYILFVNPNEPRDSSQLFLTAKNSPTDYLVLEPFQTDDKFGFISIIESSTDRYELAVGTGGVKLTTETNTKNLKKDAEEMTKIVSSIPQK